MSWLDYSIFYVFYLLFAACAHAACPPNPRPRRKLTQAHKNQ